MSDIKKMDFKKFDVLIIGAGLSGSVCARFLAEKYNRKVLILERRNHIAGNMFDYTDENGILVHKYGPHVFHTYKEFLQKFMKQYSLWVPYNIKCKVYMEGKFTPSPFNFQTIDDYYSKEEAERLKREILKTYSGLDKVTILELLESESSIIRQYANFLFEKDYSLYTAKQWGISPKEIDPSVLKRVPVLFSYKDGYFDDTYQMLPQKGYAEFFKNLLDHPNIEIKLNVEAMDYLAIEEGQARLNNKPANMPIVYTGAIDKLLNCIYGALPYRSLRFEWKTQMTDSFQDAPMVAYPETLDYTRITEYKKFLSQNVLGVTSLAYEYPLPYTEDHSVEPYYPILTENSQVLHKKYMEKLEAVRNFYLCGRLADFKYYNMDQALERALEMCDIIGENL